MHYRTEIVKGVSRADRPADSSPLKWYIENVSVDVVIALEKKMKNFRLRRTSGKKILFQTRSRRLFFTYSSKNHCLQAFLNYSRR